MKLQLVEQLKLKAVSVSTFALEILCYLTRFHIGKREKLIDRFPP